ncbi:MAG: acyltransferase [Chitinophagaceae bacterium]|nr:acyltransferase [Chitinophagaceae bacterium]
MHVYFHSLTYLNEMMAGAYLAYSIKQNNKIIQFVRSFNWKQSLIFYFFIPLFFVAYFFLDKMCNGIANNILYVIMRMLFIIHCCLLVADQLFNINSIFNLANKKLVVYTGKISYGLYCYHGFVISFGTIGFKKSGIILHPLLSTFILLIITFIIASFSYRYIEKPFLKLKDKLRRI